MSKKPSSSEEQPNISAEEIIRIANILYFRSGIFERTQWMGVDASKCPMDMWMYQELMFRLRTDLVIETGTLAGGSALFFAHMLDQLGAGKVITIDINARPNLPEHPRIEYWQGSSIEQSIIEKLKPEVAKANSVMVILDADHRAPFKLKELELYGPLVTLGNYLIAEDSCFDAYPAWPEYGPGPATAVNTFLGKNDSFIADRAQEHHLISFAPAGFLKRIK